jgi:hypothetical protein
MSYAEPESALNSLYLTIAILPTPTANSPAICEEAAAAA